MKTAEVRTRVEPKLKKGSNKIFKRPGLSESEGVRLLLKGLVIHQGIPFEFKIPNEETLTAMEEVEKGIYSKGYIDVDEYEEKEIAVKGTIKEYNGKPEIILKNEKHISVIDKRGK